MKNIEERKAIKGSKGPRTDRERERNLKEWEGSDKKGEGRKRKGERRN